MSERRHLFGIVIIAALVVVACGGGSTASAELDSGPTAAAHDPAEVATAVADFVAAMQHGEGSSACAYLRDDEKALFVSNAATIAAFAAAATSCEDVVAAFPVVAGPAVDDLDGSFSGIQIVDDIATGSWEWSTGDQRAMLQHGAAGWQFMYNANDFPSALLHIGE